MFKYLLDFVAMIHELAGDFGLVVYLSIEIFNIYYYQWHYPRKIQRLATIDSIETKTQAVNQRIQFGFINGPFSVFALGIFLIPGPALWIKIFSGAVFAALLISFMATVWLLLTRKGFSAHSEA